MVKKIAIVVNDISRAQEHEWFVDFIDRKLFDIYFVLINSADTEMSRFLEQRNVPVEHYKYQSKKDLPVLVYKLFVFFKKHRFNIVHTHLFDSSIVGLTAAYLAGVPMRIMTRHYSDYHHKYFPSAVKYDKYMNRLATHIVAISKNVENILINDENVDKDKIYLIHHGLNMSEYEHNSVSENRIEAIRRKYNLVNVGPVIGAISRFTELKGLQYLIPAFRKYLLVQNKAILLMANASGDYSNEISKLLSEIPQENIRIVKFENDIAALYKVFDCFVHIPVSTTVEAFGQTYIEALASRVPSVFTLSGVAPEFIENKENAFVVDFCDSDQVFDAISYILNNKPSLNNMIESGFSHVATYFNIEIKMKKIEKLYLNTL